MKLTIKTYATLRKYAPEDTPLGGSFEINIDAENITDIRNFLKIPESEKLIVMVNGNRTTDLEQKVNENDTVVFFPQLGGG